MMWATISPTEAGQVSGDPERFDRFVASVRAFRDDRNWAQFHDPKSLILALVGEVGELAELFQWIPAAEAAATFSEGHEHQRASEEIADVFIYLLGLADALGVDLLPAAEAKLTAAQARFPVALVEGIAPEKH